jgi:hypothetical protein
MEAHQIPLPKDYVPLTPGMERSSCRSFGLPTSTEPEQQLVQQPVQQPLKQPVQQPVQN